MARPRTEWCGWLVLPAVVLAVLLALAGLAGLHYLP